MNRALEVYVAYVSPEQQFYLQIPFVDGMTAADAIEKSGIRQKVQLSESLQLGIFGTKLENDQHRLQAGDRIEIYRALTINPKEIRRNRAALNPVGRFGKGNRFKQ